MSKRRLRLLIVVPIIIIVGIQLIPVWLLQTNSPTVSEPSWDSTQTRVLAQRSCFDCHSNQTNWPLYSRIAPVSWLVTRDVLSGRRHLNLSEWGASAGASRRPDRVANEVRREISRGDMPPSYYVLVHPDAKLTDAEKQQLIDGLVSSLK